MHSLFLTLTFICFYLYTTQSAFKEVSPRKKCKARKNPAEENGECVTLKSKSTNYPILTCDFECL